MSTVWHALTGALDRARDAGRTVRVWLRDDDAVAVTPALERLERLCARLHMPILLAVIPGRAEDALGPWIGARPGLSPCQHGWRHANHAAPGERARELGGTRARPDLRDDLARGRARMRDLFGTRLAPVLVPPWNRIDDALLPDLPLLGLTALSAFGPPPADTGPLPRLNADLDIVDWRNGRRGRAPADIAARLATLVATAREEARPHGLLTHHLAHDDVAWTTLEDLLAVLHGHPAVRFVDWCEALRGLNPAE